MNNQHNKVFLFVHLISVVQQSKPALKKPVRALLFSHLKKTAVEKGIGIISVGGAEDHIHVLLQLLPAQNLSQVVSSIQKDAAGWLNENKLLAEYFDWQPEYRAYSVSPGSIRQVLDYIAKQEQYHYSKSLESELETFDKASQALQTEP